MQDLRSKVYFDTDAWRRIGEALSVGALSAEMRQRIVLSPITLLELLSQLALDKDKGLRVLRQIQSVCNWVDPNHREILPWPSAAIAQFGFGVTLQGDSVEVAKRNLAICMSAQNVEEVQIGALKVMDALRQMKTTAVGLSKQLAEVWREGNLKRESFDEVWVSVLARGLGIDPSPYLAADVAEALSAYHEFEQERLLVAVQNPTYNFEKSANDILDAQQLVYLAESRLSFLTGDAGYRRRIKKSRQRTRIHPLGPKALNTGDDVEIVLRCILT